MAEILHMEGVLLVRPGRTVSLHELLRLGALTCEARRAASVSAAVFDFSGTEFVLTPQEWERSFIAAHRWYFDSDLAMAVVTTAAERDFFLSRASRWAQHGIVQSVFTSLPIALKWGRQHADPRPQRLLAALP